MRSAYILYLKDIYKSLTDTGVELGINLDTCDRKELNMAVSILEDYLYFEGVLDTSKNSSKTHTSYNSILHLSRLYDNSRFYSKFSLTQSNVVTLDDVKSANISDTFIDSNFKECALSNFSKFKEDNGVVDYTDAESIMSEVNTDSIDFSNYMMGTASNGVDDLFGGSIMFSDGGEMYEDFYEEPDNILGGVSPSSPEAIEYDDEYDNDGYDEYDDEYDDEYEDEFYPEDFEESDEDEEFYPEDFEDYSGSEEYDGEEEYEDFEDYEEFEDYEDLEEYEEEDDEFYPEYFEDYMEEDDEFYPEDFEDYNNEDDEYEDFEDYSDEDEEFYPEDFEGYSDEEDDYEYEDEDDEFYPEDFEEYSDEEYEDEYEDDDEFYPEDFGEYSDNEDEYEDDDFYSDDFEPYESEDVDSDSYVDDSFDLGDFEDCNGDSDCIGEQDFTSTTTGYSDSDIKTGNSKQDFDVYLASKIQSGVEGLCNAFKMRFRTFK